MVKSKIQNPKSKIPPVLRGKTIGIIGAGTMGRALLGALLEQGMSRRALRVADPSAAARALVRRRWHLPAGEDNAQIARESDIVILAVKPQQMPAVLAGLAPHLSRRHLVISIAAGIPLRVLQARLPGVPVVRVMPNLPATVRCGFSAVAAGTSASPRHRRMALALFRAVGEVVELPERALHAVTAISGSGPAYVFFLTQAWLEAARAVGLPASVAWRAIQQTLEGSARLLRAAHEPPARLIAQVASKGGTTEAALKVLAARRVQASFIDALRAAARRSQELTCR